MEEWSDTIYVSGLPKDITDERYAGGGRLYMVVSYVVNFAYTIIPLLGQTSCLAHFFLLDPNNYKPDLLHWQRYTCKAGSLAFFLHVLDLSLFPT